jgi:hypothetical protein
MQPWWHANLTARQRGADWLDDLAIHEFIDSAKTGVDLPPFFGPPVI